MHVTADRQPISFGIKAHPAIHHTQDSIIALPAAFSPAFVPLSPSFYRPLL